MIDWNMTYNSAKEDLIIPEYGRHVQLLVEYAKTLEDDDLRQRLAERIIVLMTQIIPQNRNMEDYRGKLWRHLFRISGPDLRVTPPADIVIPEDVSGKFYPEQVAYPSSEPRYRHYGHYVQSMIRKAIAMEHGPKRDGFVAAIAAYMKLAYKTWNRDHYVSDETIKADLVTLSKGALSLPDNLALENLVAAAPYNRRKGVQPPNVGNGSGGGGGKRSASGNSYSSRGRRNNNNNNNNNSGGGSRRGYKK